MIDPNNIVNRDYTDEQLEELLIFCICVAGKTASTIAPRVHKMLEEMKRQAIPFGYGKHTSYDYGYGLKPLGVIRRYLEFRNKEGSMSERRDLLAKMLKKHGIGTMKMKATSIIEAAYSFHCEDLRSIKADTLASFYGIGPKTSRFFIMCFKPESRYAALDTHILKFLKEKGIENVPKVTPGSRVAYRRLEKAFLKLVPEGKTPGEFDLEVWKSYALTD